jgi:CDP-diacylglycerol--glycerol-3-phosphate 3-phosphatidyltransferase
MTLYALKPRFQALLRPAAASLARAGVTANQVTLAAAALSVALGATSSRRFPARAPSCWCPAWLVLRMALNAVDGMLAREHGPAKPPRRVPQRAGRRRRRRALVGAVRVPRAVLAAWTAVVDRAVDRGRVRGRDGTAGRRVATLRRADGQERSRVRLRRARAVGRARAAAGRRRVGDAGGRPAARATIVNRVRGALREGGTR